MTKSQYLQPYAFDGSCALVDLTSWYPCLNKTRWNPDAIVFNTWQHYGTPSYWMQTLFCESSGAIVHPITINSSYSGYLAASAITWQDSRNSYLRVKASQVSCILMYLKGEFVVLILKASVQIVNFGPHAVRVGISTTWLEASVNAVGSTVTVLTSGNVMDENSFSHPEKVINNLSLASEWPIKCLLQCFRNLVAALGAHLNPALAC